MEVIDLTGKKFGRWTVIKRELPNTKDAATRWFCKCGCGIEKIVLGYGLRSGDSKSCGCLRKELSRIRRRLRPGLAGMRQLIIAYKSNAKKKGRSFELSEEQFAKITKQDCYYCGTKPNNIYKSFFCSGDYIYNGLDRIDNTKGYTIENVVPCCRFCNAAKSNRTEQEFKNWSERLYKKLFEIKD